MHRLVRVYVEIIFCLCVHKSKECEGKKIAYSVYVCVAGLCLHEASSRGRQWASDGQSVANVNESLDDSICLCVCDGKDTEGSGCPKRTLPLRLSPPLSGLALSPSRPSGPSLRVHSGP